MYQASNCTSLGVKMRYFIARQFGAEHLDGSHSTEVDMFTQVHFSESTLP
jgi:hypothetical protein